MKEKKLNNLEEEIIKKYSRRDKKKKPKMKVSGHGVFKLKEIIKRKGRNN